MRDKDFDIKHPKKKFQKTERVPPEGYECANDFFEDMYMDKDMIWMGQNTNHLHDDTIADAMIEAIKEKTFCRYPAPEGFSELKQLVLDDLGFEDLEVLLTSGATESLYLCMQALLEPEDNVILSDPGYFIIGDFANRFAGEVRYVPIYYEENNYKLTPDLLRENMDENTRYLQRLCKRTFPCGKLRSRSDIDNIQLFKNIWNGRFKDWWSNIFKTNYRCY